MTGHRETVLYLNSLSAASGSTPVSKPAVRGLGILGFEKQTGVFSDVGGGETEPFTLKKRTRPDVLSRADLRPRGQKNFIKGAPDFPRDLRSRSLICESLSKPIEPRMPMRLGLIGRSSERRQGFDLCPLATESHGVATATRSTLRRPHDWTHACRATPGPDETIAVTNDEDETQKEQVGEGGGVIDSWSERLCPLICRPEERGCGLRCFRMSLFVGFRIPVRSHQQLFHHPTPGDSPPPSAAGPHDAQSTAEVRGQSMFYKRLIQILLVNERSLAL